MEQRRVLTIYGYRGGWIEHDQSVNGDSIMRGYASLNGRVNLLVKENPNMVIHNVSHATTTIPPESTGYFTVVMSVTVLYSGEVAGVTSVRTDGKHVDDSPGYGTVIRMDL